VYRGTRGLALVETDARQARADGVRDRGTIRFNSGTQVGFGLDVVAIQHILLDRDS